MDLRERRASELGTNNDPIIDRITVLNWIALNRNHARRCSGGPE